jgi:MFS family permease
MDMHNLEQGPRDDGYLFGRRQAWFAFAMTLALMVFDYVDRQIIVSLFPYLKAEWDLSDKQLGALVSVISLTVALFGIPVALYADRKSRVKSIVAMAAAWSLATISCMWARAYGQLLVARALVGLGEAGYGSVGAALIASHFPARMRGALMAGFFASASVGSVLGVLLGGVIATHWGWRAAFGVVGIPGLLLSLAYLTVRDYRTVAMAPRLEHARLSVIGAAQHIVRALAGSRTMVWVCVGAAAQLIVVSALWSWLPSFLIRVHGMAPAQASAKAALVVLAGAAGSVVWGALVDRVGKTQPRRKLALMSALCVATLAVLMTAFGGAWDPQPRFTLILAGGFLMTCTVGPVAAIVFDVINPGIRATGASVLSLFQNLFGLAIGPLIAGALSDAWGLTAALTVVPAFSLLAALAFLRAARSYESEKALVTEPADAMPIGDAVPA